MPHLFKSHMVDDDQYPMPQPPQRPAHRPDTGIGHDQAHDADMVATARVVDPAELHRTAGELDHIMETVSRLAPAVDQLTHALKTGAQQQGYEEGRAHAQAELQQHLLDAAAALTEAQAQRHMMAQQNSAALADLALRIARKVIGEHLAADTVLVARVVEQAVRELEPTTRLAVHVHADDLAAVQQRKVALDRLVSGGSVEIVADETVDRGGCILVSPVGEVDARISTKLSVLEAAFAAQRRTEGEAGT